MVDITSFAMPPENITSGYLPTQLESVTSAAMTTAIPDQSDTTVQPDAPTLTPIQRHFLVVFVLAVANVILGSIYAFLWYRGKRKHTFTYIEESAIPLKRKKSSAMSDNSNHKYKRRMSTHIALSVGQNRQSSRSVSSAFL
jgi:hypothetical protein